MLSQNFQMFFRYSNFFVQKFVLLKNLCVLRFFILKRGWTKKRLLCIFSYFSAHTYILRKSFSFFPALFILKRGWTKKRWQTKRFALFLYILWLLVWLLFFGTPFIHIIVWFFPSYYSFSYLKMQFLFFFLPFLVHEIWKLWTKKKENVGWFFSFRLSVVVKHAFKKKYCLCVTFFAF